jgi:hypothetical protein
MNTIYRKQKLYTISFLCTICSGTRKMETQLKAGSDFHAFPTVNREPANREPE